MVILLRSLLSSEFSSLLRLAVLAEAGATVKLF